ncbi:MAG TPA: amidohydrolase family protein [Nonomuraea sp.]|nr:amidohydrolase family protein [Nonomuraea sp.]
MSMPIGIDSSVTSKVALWWGSGLPVPTIRPSGRRLVELGMSPMNALIAATRNASELLGISDEVGTLETGKLADLVVTDADPIRDIHALADPSRIQIVMKAGVFMKDLGKTAAQTTPV